MIFFLDPAFIDSFLATLLMSISMALIGTVCVVKKKSLTGEMLSHAALPGVAFAHLVFGSIAATSDALFSLIVMFSALCGCMMILKWAKRLIASRYSEDATLSMLLAWSLGLGVLIQSLMQKKEPLLYKKSQLFFFGQAATLMQEHVVIYGVLAVVLSLVFVLVHNRLKWLLFDESFVLLLHPRMQRLDAVIQFFIALAICIGIRSVGVILVSGMLIIPVMAARRWSLSLAGLYVLSALFALMSAVIGNALSFIIPAWLDERYGLNVALPLGPMMIIVAFAILMVSVVVSNRDGWLILVYKQLKATHKIHEENGLKRLWKVKQKKRFGYREMIDLLHPDPLVARWLFLSFLAKGFLASSHNGYCICQKGLQSAAHIVRIHRLFEVYLSKELNVDLKNVHGIAEELEHVITPEMERELSALLKNPLTDPHLRPIPQEKERR